LKLTPEQIALIEGGITTMRGENFRLQALDREIKELKALLDAKGAEQMELMARYGSDQINEVLQSAIKAK